MYGVKIFGKNDARVVERDNPQILDATDAIIKVVSSCICGSDLWAYRGTDAVTGPKPMGHEYVGEVVEIGKEVTTLQVGDFVVGSFIASDNTCENCLRGYQSKCIHAVGMDSLGAQAEYLRVPLADGTLVATPGGQPDQKYIPSLLAASDVLGTGWFGALAARVQKGSTVVVVGDGAVGLLGILSAKQMGADRIIAMSRHSSRQKLALTFGATDIVEERGAEGVKKIRDLTNGYGAGSVIEAVGSQQSMLQAIDSTRPGGSVGYVGWSHDVKLNLGEQLFFKEINIFGGPAPVRGYLPELINLILTDKINPGLVFDMTLPLEKAAEGYAAMDKREAIKVRLIP